MNGKDPRAWLSAKFSAIVNGHKQRPIGAPCHEPLQLVAGQCPAVRGRRGNHPQRIEAVERICPDAVVLRVTLDAPQKPRHTGRGFDVRLHLDHPAPDLEVPRTVRHGHAADDIVRAANATFTALDKRIKETRRVTGGQEVKHHPEILHGEIVELKLELACGFVRADDGRKVYFQKDGLVTGA